MRESLTHAVAECRREVAEGHHSEVAEASCVPFDNQDTQAAFLAAYTLWAVVYIQAGNPAACSPVEIPAACNLWACIQEAA